MCVSPCGAFGLVTLLSPTSLSLCAPTGVFVSPTPLAPACGSVLCCSSAVRCSLPASRARNSLRSSRAGVRPAPPSRGCSPALRCGCAPPLVPHAPVGRSRGFGFPAPYGRVCPAPLGESGRPRCARAGVFFGWRTVQAPPKPKLHWRATLAPSPLRCVQSPHLRREVCPICQ